MKELPISVIIPNFNSGNFLVQAVESIFKQEYIPKECIIVDDCSTDGSFDIATSISKTYRNITILKNDTNSGALLSRQRGIDFCSQDLVCLLDADDFLEDDAISNAYFLLTKENADISLFDLFRFESTEKYYPVFNKKYKVLSGQEACKLTLNGWKIHSFGVAKKELYVNAFSELKQDMQEVYNADELFDRVVLFNSLKVVQSDSPYYYRLNPSSTTQQKSPKHLKFLDSCKWILEFAQLNYKLDFKEHLALLNSYYKNFITIVKDYNYFLDFYGKRVLSDYLLKHLEELCSMRKQISIKNRKSLSLYLKILLLCIYRYKLK